MIDKKPYKREEAFNESLKYFNNDELATNVWINKYALKDSEGNIYELTPNDMHRRLAKELHRIESKYQDALTENEIFDLIKDFKYIVPQGGPMSGIGNDNQIVSLSNCFVIGNKEGSGDSYGAIMKIDQEQAQLMKRRGGVGSNLSDIRPSGMPVNNSALTSTGVVPFMERYSNTTREVAQDGRRGALMLTIPIKHPDAEQFIDAKLEDGKITGANISVMIDNEFMNCVINDKPYKQQYPINSDNPKVVKEINAKKLWKKIIHNAWKSAEPGVLFWDNVIDESVPDHYQDVGYKTVSTNPCAELPLSANDSCRLLAINLFSYVDNPFTKNAKFNFEKFKRHANYAQRLMDDIVDLEIEKIDQIIAKIETDPEEEEIKRVEKNLWIKIKKMAVNGRRTGLGVTAEGDMLAAMGLTYGTKKATNFSENIHKILATESYRASVEMAKERGAFPVWNLEKEKDAKFIQRVIYGSGDKKLIRDYEKYGRRNIANLTIAPTGTVSLMTQTTSGIEPVFLPTYKRSRKVNPNDKDVNVAYKDKTGDHWEEYTVFHHKFIDWLKINGYNVEEVRGYDDDKLEEIVKKSPYYKATSNDVDWVEKVRMQGAIQKWVDHSISVTVNLPKETTQEIVSKVYETGWEVGCKGVTIYRDGSRDGVLNKNSSKTDKQEPDVFTENNAPRRPKYVKCDVMKFMNKGDKWIGFLGIKDGRPYEIFTGLEESFPVPHYVTEGTIVRQKGVEKDGHSRYDFKYVDKDGYEQELKGLSRAFNKEFWNTGRWISAILRHGMPIPNVIQMVDGAYLNGSDSEGINTWKNGVKRMLKKHIKDGTKMKGSMCETCGSYNVIFVEGCEKCMSCGSSKCG